MTLTADTKKRVVLPGSAPGDVFAFQQNGDEIVLRRVYRKPTGTGKKMTKTEVRKAVRNWKSLKGVKWEDLRKMTREI